MPDSQLYATYFKVGVNDIIRIKIYDRWPYSQEPKSEDVKIRVDGTILVLPLGKIKVNHLSLLEIEKKLTEELKDYLNTPMVSVEMIQNESNRILIYGEFGNCTRQNAQTVKMDRPMRLSEIVAHVGGLGLKGDGEHIKIIHNNGKIDIINLDEIIFQNRLDKDMYLKCGDMVYVPTSEFSKVFVIGEVNQPGIITIQHNNTIMDILASAGGCTERAYLPMIKIVRTESGTATIFDVDVRSIVKHGKIKENIVICHGDIIYVPKSKLAKTQQIMAMVANLISTTAQGYYLINTLTGSK